MRDARATDRYEKAVRAHQAGHIAEAERLYRDALDHHPGNTKILHGLGALCAQTGRIREAIPLLQQALRAAPDNLEIRGNLGQALLRIGHANEALPHLLANSGNGDATLFKSIGDALQRLGRFGEAVGWYQKALATRPGYPAALMGLGDALSVMGQIDGAKRAFTELLTRDPNHAAAHHGLGVVLRQQGLEDEARRAFNQAITLNPKEPAFHRALAETERFVKGDPRLAPLEDLQHNAMSVRQMVELHFALGKAYDDLGRHALAFEHWSNGNAAQRTFVSYDETAHMEVFRALTASFTAQAVSQSGGHPSDLPIFVVGMPRAGTSLIEQVLASHPDVFGAGELTFLNQLVAEGAAGKDYPRSVPTPEMCRALGARYVERVAPLAPDAKHIVDKLPGNFLHIGLIHLALPQARIVHLQRDPIDTCFSCWTKLFPGMLDYTYEFGELARYYKAYDKLMAHWRSVLPQGTIIEMRYETLVENFASEARRLVESCGLAWDERCLAFHKNRRAVRTLSQAQVRQPLFKTSIGRWRRYEQWLHPLIEALR